MKNKTKTYKINGKELRLKERYTFGDWQKVMRFLRDVKPGDMVSLMELILDESKIIALLGVIAEGDIPTILYEEDFSIINEMINDFFLRKTSLMRLTKDS